jgi:hypothetical protein
MNDARAQNTVSEFKTPTYVSPEKNDIMLTAEKTALPYMKVTQFQEVNVIKIEE